MATACINNEEFWKECASWLTRWGILRGDHRANWLNATIVDLANTLRDGVLLCNLLGKIDPPCIDMKNVNLKPAMARFLCLRNIQLFLRTCKLNFNLRDQELFEDVMLFDLVNFHKVLCTLSKLSVTPKAQERFRGFSIQDEKTREEEDIYQSLKTIDLKPTCLTGIEPSWLQFTIPCPQLDQEEDVYDDLCYVTFSTCHPEVGNFSFEPPIRNTFDSEEYTTYYDHDEDTYQSLMQLRIDNGGQSSEPLEKRDYVVKELVDTEKNYVEVLLKIKKNFMQKLNIIIKPEHHSVIFLNIVELYEIHQGFYNQLRMHEKNLRLSSVFIQFKERFLVYGSYCSNLSVASTTLQDICEKNHEVCKKIEELEKQDNNGKFKLRDILSVPMQRILKYHLLLDKLIEFTEPKHEDYLDLKKAREAMVDVAGYINEYTRDKELLNVLNSVRDNIIEWDCPVKLEQFGKLVRDGEIKIKPHDDGKIRTRYIFLFQKCMILCKPLKDNKFAFRDMFSLNDIRVEDVNNRPLLNQNARWGYQWLLVKSDTSIAYTCSVRSIEIKMQILKSLKDCMENLKPIGSTTHNFELHTFDKPQSCSRCSKYLKGLIFQGYKCKKCFIDVHKECIATSGSCGASSLLPPPLPPSHTNHLTDESLNEKLWFVGEMDRVIASSCLQNRSNGTFLVRVRPQCDGQDRYALSLKTDNAVKHMKICSSTDGSGRKFFLSRARYFNSIENLIENYQTNTLRESFERLQENTLLEWSYKQLRVVATRDFEPSDPRHIQLREGHELIVVGQEGFHDGWWKGSCVINGITTIGYFPKAYVRVLEKLHNTPTY